MQWLDDPTAKPDIEKTSDPQIAKYSELLHPHMIELLQIALIERPIRNRVAQLRKRLRQLADTHMENAQVESTNDGHRRMGTVIQRLHEFITNTAWKTGRNDILHNATATQVTQITTTLEDAEVSEYFQHPNLLLATDQHYCSGCYHLFLKVNLPTDANG